MRTIKTNEQGYNMKTQPLHRSKRMKKKTKILISVFYALLVLDIKFSLFPQILPPLPRCIAGARAIQTWLFAPGLNLLTPHQHTTLPPTGKSKATRLASRRVSLRSSCLCVLMCFVSERHRQSVTKQCHLIQPGSPSSFLSSASSSSSERVPLLFYFYFTFILCCTVSPAEERFILVTFVRILFCKLHFQTRHTGLSSRKTPYSNVLLWL